MKTTNQTQVDFRKQGLGKFVRVTFEKNVKIDVGRMATDLKLVLGTKVGHMATSQIIEFFWDEDANAGEINKFLNNLQEHHPKATLGFSKTSCMDIPV